ncbi:transposase [Streptomyces spiralis]|uniref:transposase n=1 Tax=Streptomyces spiralis TaxID=66376 RepID=UPI00369B7078
MARLLIQGHCVISPFLPRARFRLTGQDSPALRALLSGEPHAIQSGTPTCVITVAGRHLDLGPVRSYPPHITVDEEDGRQAPAALDTGRGEGCEVTVRPVDGECFRLGLVLAVAVTAASVQDRDAAVPLLERLRNMYFSIRLVWADGGYSGRLVDWAAEKLQLTLEIVKRTDDSACVGSPLR